MTEKMITLSLEELKELTKLAWTLGWWNGFQQKTEFHQADFYTSERLAELHKDRVSDTSKILDRYSQPEQKVQVSLAQWEQQEIALAGLRTGDAATISLAFQLAGVPACEQCGYVIQHCKCSQKENKHDVA